MLSCKTLNLHKNRFGFQILADLEIFAREGPKNKSLISQISIQKDQG
jgi:hypothetical protein